MCNFLSLRFRNRNFGKPKPPKRLRFSKFTKSMSETNKKVAILRIHKIDE